MKGKPVNYQRPFTTQDISTMIDDARRKEFWGSIELQIQGGEVITVKKIQTLKKGNNRFNDPRSNS